MRQPVVFIAGPGSDALTMKAREQRRRASSIKAFVVVKDANPQTVDLRALKKRMK
jgi:hypothetical protein